MSNNSAKTIDGLFENYSYKDALRLLGFDRLLTCLSISPVETTTKVKPESFAKTCLTKMMTLIQKQNTVMKCVTD